MSSIYVFTPKSNLSCFTDCVQNTRSYSSTATDNLLDFYTNKTAASTDINLLSLIGP